MIRKARVPKCLKPVWQSNLTTAGGWGVPGHQKKTRSKQIGSFPRPFFAAGT
jgi:hypothetical protein